MTMDMVATRAKAGKATVCRRWSPKGELVVGAAAGMKTGNIDYDHLPDSGTLRGDLLAMIKPHSIETAKKNLQVMAGVTSMLSRAPELADAADAAHAALVEPRATDRGEFSADYCDVETLALISRSMASYRVLILPIPVALPSCCR